MSSPGAYLFVYGTLRKGFTRMSDLIAGYIEWAGSGGINGRLYDIGSYPGAIEEDTGSLLIRGEIMLVKDPLKVFKLLDRYEGFYPDKLDRSAFVRRKQVVYLDDGQRPEAWVYWYNFSVDGKAEIPGKDYLEYLKQKGKRI